jgi:hypothetical protein
MAQTTTKTLIDRLPEVARGIRTLAENRVYVGVPASKAGRSGGEISNADLAYIHENGAPTVGIPARPFLKPGVASIRRWVEETLVKIGRSALDGRPEAVTRGLNALGLRAQSAVRAKINEGVPPPLRPGTLAARRRRGRTGTKPLIDTGQLRNAITYVIRRVTGRA